LDLLQFGLSVLGVLVLAQLVDLVEYHANAGSGLWHVTFDNC